MISQSRRELLLHIWLAFIATLGIYYFFRAVDYRFLNEDGLGPTLLNKQLWYFSHALFALPMMFGAPLQFLPGLRRKAPHVPRMDGTATQLDSGEVLLVGGSSRTKLPTADDNPAVIAICERYNLTAIDRGPLAMGLLTGKYTAETKASADDVRGERSPDWMMYFAIGRPSPEWLAGVGELPRQGDLPVEWTVPWVGAGSAWERIDWKRSAMA